MKKIKKLIVILYLILIPFSLAGCNHKDHEADEFKPPWLLDITGEITKTNLNDDGDIVILKSEITENVRYYNYVYEGVEISLLAVKDSLGDYKVVINTCQSCNGSPYAYFVQDGNKIKCQNCGSSFLIDNLGELEDDGCNPFGIENLVEDESTITISHTELEEYKDMFENWEGPKI